VEVIGGAGFAEGGFEPVSSVSLKNTGGNFRHNKWVFISEGWRTGGGRTDPERGTYNHLTARALPFCEGLTDGEEADRVLSGVAGERMRLKRGVLRPPARLLQSATRAPKLAPTNTHSLPLPHSPRLPRIGRTASSSNPSPTACEPRTHHPTAHTLPPAQPPTLPPPLNTPAKKTAQTSILIHLPPCIDPTIEYHHK